MEQITVREILAIARRESEQANQLYLGVEHLLVALTRLQGGVTAVLLDQRGLLGFFYAALAKEKYPETEEQRFWPDYRITERAQKVLDLTSALIDGGIDSEDRALLIAILQEGDSVGVRLLQELGADLPGLLESVRGWSERTPITPPPIPIKVDDAAVLLQPAHERLLRLMFRGADQIYIRRGLMDGFSGSVVLLVQVKQAILNAPVVVKLDERQAIQYEKLRYDQFVKGILPPNTASIVDEPSFLPDNTLGGIKYTFVSKPGEDTPANARQYANARGMPALAKFLRESLYDTFRHYWWGQGRPVRFQTWQEYELLLPPALTVQIIPPEEATANLRTLHPNGVWSRSSEVRTGETLILENFIAQKTKKADGVLQLSAGPGSEAAARASRVDVRGLDLEANPVHRGQPVGRLVCRVVKTRADHLLEQVQALEPTFDIFSGTIYGPNNRSVVNPLSELPLLLERWTNGTLSPIHGDLHTGNILVGPANDAWLIDFEWTRQGHALFDWAVLETSLITDLIMPHFGDSWDSAWEAVRLLGLLNDHQPLPESLDANLRDAFAPVLEVREIVLALLASPKTETEYFTALAMCSLRVPSWQNRPPGARRAMFLAAGLYMEQVRTRADGTRDTESMTKTVTDMAKGNSPRKPSA